MSSRVVAATTVPGMPVAWPALVEAGFAVERFAADGAGGRALEAGVRAGRFAGVLDLVAEELAAELFGTPGGAGPDRLTAAGLKGVPQVISVGLATELSAEQADRLGLEIAQKACAAKGPTAIMLPMRGVVLAPLTPNPSPAEGVRGKQALFQSLRNWIHGVEVVVLQLHISDAEFSAAAEAKLLELMQ